MVQNVQKIENPRIFRIVLIFLILSVGLLVFGLLKGNKDIKTSDDENITDNRQESDSTGDDESLLQYFENVNLTQGEDGEDDYFLQTDPFKDACAETSGDGKPAISFGTVCYR